VALTGYLYTISSFNADFSAKAIPSVGTADIKVELIVLSFSSLLILDF
jgi:hypothetical protein